MRSMLQSWRALRLNQGVSELVERRCCSLRRTWAAAEGDVPREGPAYWGVDLGGSAAQSAVAAYWPATGRLEALAAFPRSPFAPRARPEPMVSARSTSGAGSAGI